MKRLVLLLMFLLLINSALAVRDVIKPGESMYDDGMNLTLLKIAEDKAIVCVNNVKKIINEDELTTIGRAVIELKQEYGDKAYIELKGDNGSKCTGDCLNLLCFDKKSEDEEVQEMLDIVEDYVEPEPEEVVETQNVPVQGVVIGVLIVVIGFLGLMVLWKRIK